MSDDPWIGDPSAAANDGRCCFGGNMPGDPKCTSPATRHLMSESAIYGRVGLPTCDVHAPLARVAGLLHGEHAYTETCLPELTYWTADGCIPVPPAGPYTEQETTNG